MATMKAVRIHGFGGPEVMQLEDLPIPQPAADEILLRVHAASVNSLRSPPGRASSTMAGSRPGSAC